MLGLNGEPLSKKTNFWTLQNWILQIHVDIIASEGLSVCVDILPKVIDAPPRLHWNIGRSWLR